MGRQLHRLSARRVEALRDPGRHADGGGLYLSISARGGRRWVFLYRRAGKLREMGLGSARDVPLAKARALAADARRLVGAGEDPIDAKRASKAAQAPPRPVTFGDVAHEYLAAMAPSRNSAKHREQWEVSLGVRDPRRGAEIYAKPLREKSVAEITTGDVLSILRPVWQSKPEMASRLRGRVEAVLDAARARGLRTGENPARWRGHLDKLLPRPKRLSRGHHAAMPFEEVPIFVRELRERGSISARALEFLILCAARSGEVRGALWSEIDVGAAVWRVPADRMKWRREHRVPLVPRALEIIEGMGAIRCSEYVFPGARQRRPLSEMAFEMLFRRLGRTDITTHGFRSSFRDWTGECTHFAREIAEAALAHQVGDATERAYRRGDALQKRRELMVAWASFLEGELAGDVRPPHTLAPRRSGETDPS
jgi:integrase